jgi:hypothetical protein
VDDLVDAGLLDGEVAEVGAGGDLGDDRVDAAEAGGTLAWRSPSTGAPRP